MPEPRPGEQPPMPKPNKPEGKEGLPKGAYTPGELRQLAGVKFLNPQQTNTVELQQALKADQATLEINLQQVGNLLDQVSNETRDAYYNGKDDSVDAWVQRQTAWIGAKREENNFAAALQSWGLDGSAENLHVFYDNYLKDTSDVNNFAHTIASKYSGGYGREAFLNDFAAAGEIFVWFGNQGEALALRDRILAEITANDKQARANFANTNITDEDIAFTDDNEKSIYARMVGKKSEEGRLRENKFKAALTQTGEKKQIPDTVEAYTKECEALIAKLGLPWTVNDLTHGKLFTEVRKPSGTPGDFGKLEHDGPLPQAIRKYVNSVMEGIIDTDDLEMGIGMLAMHRNGRSELNNVKDVYGLLANWDYLQLTPNVKSYLKSLQEKFNNAGIILRARFYAEPNLAVHNGVITNDKKGKIGSAAIMINLSYPVQETLQQLGSFIPTEETKSHLLANGIPPEAIEKLAE